MIKNNFDIGDFVTVLTPQMAVANLVERAKTRRKEKGFSQQELAKITGVSYASIKRFEQTGEIALSSLVCICDAIGCLEDINALFKNRVIKSIKDL